MDILGKALKDFYEGRKNQPTLLIHNHYGDPDFMDPAIYFRNPQEMPKVELFAMSLCEGRILDVGAGVGAHVLHLQKQGLDITAVELSEVACKIMKKRGVTKIINKDFFEIKESGFDMIFCMMNGIGFAGTIEGLKYTLDHARKLLVPGGMILFDSSDVSYLYPKGRLKAQPYFGELDYCYQYGDTWGNWFKWLYIDHRKMAEISREMGWHLQILYQDQTGHFLGGMKLSG